ncbi:MAG: flavodoxin-dependent (E)-4-hydroxy-3-methylbut-2-enyl-diphosphate synthase [Planctomycetota bacterium]|nr:flavodoxin-dependent (E)-4-hydroxy-3-methylbut-2-enyl-diphosphate synthase [Planctomycetota bacterium]
MAGDKRFARRPSRAVHVGPVPIGGAHPVSIQSMTTTHTRDVRETLAQIRRLAAAGCDLVRVAVPSLSDADALAELVRSSPVPLIADIHFTTSLALKALDAGVAKVRLNPGNIDDPDGLRRVLARAAELGRPIRFGVNSGSVRGARRPKPHLERSERWGRRSSRPLRGCRDLARLMVDVLMEWVRKAETEGFRDLVLSAKASDVPTTLQAYRLLAEACDLPLHLGITAAGPMDEARTRSAIVLGTLLSEGIGDTVRVSLTGSSVNEVLMAQEILAELGLRPRLGIRILSCPTCGRCEVDLIGLVEALKARTRDVLEPLTVAVMGCVVNGPGEAVEADVGVAAGKGHGMLFREGKALRKVPEKDLLDALLDEIRTLAESRSD